MKNIILLFVFITISIVMSAKDLKQANKNDPESQTTEITWVNNSVIDLGKIEKGKPVTVTFECKNTGTKPLLITSAKGQCGCTSVTYTQTVIDPDKKGFVKATYNAASSGTFTKYITVIANISGQQSKLTIKGEVL